MTNILMTVQVARTRLYRVLLAGAQLATLVALFADRFGVGIGLTPWDIGLIDTIASSVILIGRQVGDPTTQTKPDPAVPPLP